MAGVGRGSEYWDNETLLTRVADVRARRRHQAGSPNAEEIALYGQLLQEHVFKNSARDPIRVVVLGMTPELRNLALRRGHHVTSVDSNRKSIELFRDWISPEFKTLERIIEGDWLNLASILDEPVHAVLGDGVFGNLLTLENYRRLLGILKKSLTGEGCLILRTIMIPNGLDVRQHATDRLLEQFRAGTLSEAEFGFGMRIFGSFAEAYDTETYRLDNEIVFARYEDWEKRGVLSEEECSVIHRYYFGGVNLIPPQEVWEALIVEEGFSFSCRPLLGRMWYEYYPIYLLTLNAQGSAGDYYSGVTK